VSLSQSGSKQVWRIVDANLNRIGEGLRLLEDVSRFILNDAHMSESLKSLRHELTPHDLDEKERCLSARDAAGDVGADIMVGLQTRKRELCQAVVANARRVEESLRVLEEIAKLQGSGLDSQRYQSARFKLYDTEKELVSRLLRQDKAEQIYGLYAVIDTDCLKGKDFVETASQLLAGGTKLIQLRDKKSGKKELLSLALALKNMCAREDALFIVNDHLDIALAADADGLHVGQDDLPVSIARRQLPIGKLIGCSVANVQEAKQAKNDGADYVACGAIYATSTKPDCPQVGLETLRAIKGAVDLPLVAIGGINLSNVAEVMSAGADAIAVISALLLARSPQEATRELIERIESCHEPADR